MRAHTTSRTRVFAIAIAAAVAIAAGALSPIAAASHTTVAATASAPTRPPPQTPKPRTDNLVALEMGGRVENQPLRPGDLKFVPERALDGDPTTMWLEVFPPHVLTLSFIGHDTALVASVAIAYPDLTSTPLSGVNLAGARPGGVEIALSTTSPTTGFVKAISAPLPLDGKEHTVTLPAPTEARYVRLTFSPQAGTVYGKNGVAVGEIACTKDRAPATCHCFSVIRICKRCFPRARLSRMPPVSRIRRPDPPARHVARRRSCPPSVPRANRSR